MKYSSHSRGMFSNLRNLRGMFPNPGLTVATPIPEVQRAVKRQGLSKYLPSPTDEEESPPLQEDEKDEAARIWANEVPQDVVGLLAAAAARFEETGRYGHRRTSQILPY